MKKRLLSVFLSLAMALTFVQTETFANNAVNASTSSNGKIEIGDCIQLGKYYGQPIVWRCVAIDENGPLMLSDKILCLKAYDAKGDSDYHYVPGTFSSIRKQYGSNCYADSNIRQWLNSTETQVSWTHDEPSTPNVLGGNAYKSESGFLSSGNFSAEERSYMKNVTRKVYTNEAENTRGITDGGSREHNGVDGLMSAQNRDYTNCYYMYVTDTVFIPDLDQMVSVYYNFGNEHVKACPTEQAVTHSDYSSGELNSETPYKYWITHAGTNGYSYEWVRFIAEDGTCTGSRAWDGTVGIRPAFYLDESVWNNGGGDNPSRDEITFRADNDFTVNVGDETVILASIPNASNLQKENITWSSSNESVAVIESSGALISGSTASATAVIRGVSTGTTTITITLSDGRSANCTITVSSKPNEIQLPGMSTLFVGDITTATAKITLNVIDTTDSIEWSSSNRDVVAFDSDGAGNISRPIVGMTITDSQITDSVQLYARSSGTAKITCKLKSTGAEQSFNVSVITKQEAELQRLAMEWVRAYDEYNAKLKTTLSEAASGDVNKRTLDEVAKEFEETLGKKYGLTVAATGTTTEQRVLVYKALLEMLAGYTSNQLALKNISFSNLDTVPVDICDEVLNALRNETYTYTDKKTGASVRILLSDYAGAKWGLASVWESGRSGSVDVAFSSSPSSVKAVIADYTSQLLELEKAALKKSAKEAVAALSRELLGKSISTLKEDFIRNKVSIYTEQFTKLGLGDVTGVLNSCYNYYKFIDKIIGGDFSELAGMLEGTKDIDFSNPNFTTNITKKVVSKLDRVQKEILKLLSKGVTGKEEWFSVKTPTSSSTFGCPVNIVVYDSQHNAVGYVGSDDLWFDESKIYIEQNGETKVIYSAGEALTFDITATDYGTLNCTFEEYSSSSAISRVNYYDILLYAGKEIRAKIPGNNFNEYTVAVSSEEGTISADEIIPGTDYLSATVTIVCSADSVDGGQIYGSGQYVRGDPVKLFAMTENDYRFLGWQNNDGDLVSVDPVYEFTAKEDIALTALFTKQSSGENPLTPVTYTITFDANGGIVSSAPMTTNADGRLITLPIPSRVGYIFNGWYTAPTGGTRITTDTVFTENSTVYAHWTYTGSNGGSTPGSGSPSGSSNFSNGNSSSNTISIPIITGGKISVNPKSAAKGTTITITVTPDSGYELDRLTVTDADGNELTLTDKGNGKFIFTMPASKVEITASFKKIATPNEQPEHPSTPYPFTDVPAGVWYSDAVQYVYDMGMMAGITSTTFGPEVTTNRGMIVTMLYRLEGEPSVGTANFTDVPAGEWYSAAVAWVETNGIVNGTTATTFEPLVPITRQQMAAILYRYANYKGYNVGAQTDLSSFDDANQVDPYALTAMQWANTEGLITGTTSTTLAPNGDATRAQVATIMMRFCKNVAK